MAGEGDEGRSSPIGMDSGPCLRSCRQRETEAAKALTAAIRQTALVSLRSSAAAHTARRMPRSSMDSPARRTRPRTRSSDTG